VAIRITRVYTRRGDRGDTDLVGGERVPKDSPRIIAYGSVDELNAALGIVRALNAAEIKRSPACRALDALLKKLQNELFDLGSELATPPAAFQPGMFKVGPEHVKALETRMDLCQRDLKPLHSFVLPGGGRVSAFLHVARTVCRRAERLVIALARKEAVGPFTVKYLNRLSDALFVMARHENKRRGVPDVLWDSRA
jgi:cob(I)alamin adenosyltransferase